MRKIITGAAAIVVAAGIVVGGIVAGVGPQAQAATVCGGASSYLAPKHNVPTTKNDSRNRDCLLSRSGVRRSSVVVLQRSLNLCYGAGLSVDGYYGARTEQAVIKVQAKHGLARDGVFGPRTSKAMSWTTSYGCRRV